MTQTCPDGLLPCGYNGGVRGGGGAGLVARLESVCGLIPTAGSNPALSARINPSQPPKAPRRIRAGAFSLEMSSIIAQNTPCRYRASQASIMVSGVVFDGAIP